MAGDPRIAKTSTSGTPAVIQKTPDISKDLMLTLLFSSVNRTLEKPIKVSKQRITKGQSGYQNNE
jgi:hypothetical protein